jgi:hypothetical protein
MSLPQMLGAKAGRRQEFDEPKKRTVEAPGTIEFNSMLMLAEVSK